MIKKKLNSPLTSSIGRLFDGVSSLLNVCHRNTYEGEAAIRLEKIAKRTEDHYEFLIKDNVIFYEDVIGNILFDLKNGTEKGYISFKFHNGLSDLILKIIKIEIEKKNFSYVVLSGGVFQNSLLLNLIYDRIKEIKLNPVIHRKLPTNDQCISLGQTGIGYAFLRKNHF